MKVRVRKNFETITKAIRILTRVNYSTKPREDCRSFSTLFCLLEAIIRKYLNIPFLGLFFFLFFFYLSFIFFSFFSFLFFFFFFINLLYFFIYIFLLFLLLLIFYIFLFD